MNNEPFAEKTCCIEGYDCAKTPRSVICGVFLCALVGPGRNGELLFSGFLRKEVFIHKATVDRQVSNSPAEKEIEHGKTPFTMVLY